MKFDVWLNARPDFGNGHDTAIVYVSPVNGPLISVSMLTDQQITMAEIKMTISQLQQELERREHTNL